MRRSVARGQPYGSDDWRGGTAARLGLGSTLRPRGRPRKVCLVLARPRPSDRRIPASRREKPGLTGPDPAEYVSGRDRAPMGSPGPPCSFARAAVGLGSFRDRAGSGRGRADGFVSADSSLGSRVGISRGERPGPGGWVRFGGSVPGRLVGEDHACPVYLNCPDKSLGSFRAGAAKGSGRRLDRWTTKTVGSSVSRSPNQIHFSSATQISLTIVGFVSATSVQRLGLFRAESVVAGQAGLGSFFQNGSPSLWGHPSAIIVRE